jgi:putative transposase
MPRALLIRSNHHPYHITSRCQDKNFFTLPLEEVWQIMTTLLGRAHREHQLAIHAFVLMGNHFHLLCHTPKGNIDECMHFLLRLTTVEINRRSCQKNQLWHGRYRWSLIDSNRHYYQVYRYLYQNPLRASLVTRVEDYPFSTLRQDIPFPLHSSLPMTFGGSKGELLWLNEKFERQEIGLIKLGLRKSQFSLQKRKLKALSQLSLPPQE